MNLWKVDRGELQPVPTFLMDDEQRLEDWLAADPALTGLDLLIIGRQVVTPNRGRVDLLAINPDANTVILELKRAKTPREVVAQVLDYASWVQTLSLVELDSICQEYRKQPLADAFRERFGVSITDIVNEDHALVIVAASLDESSERIVQYLGDRGININVVFFNLFRSGDQELVGRAWLRDPVELEERTESRRKLPWTGFWFVNVGESEHRNWDDNRQYGFIAAGQGEKYSKPLQKLKIGDQIFAYMKEAGYVGFGEVVEEAQPVASVRLEDGELLLEKPLRAPKPSEHADDLRLSDWVVRVKWLRTFPREQARTFKGVFANQNIVCKLRHTETLQFLEREFAVGSDANPV